MIGGTGKKKHELDDPDDELPVREPRIISPTPANTIMNASIGRWSEVLEIASEKRTFNRTTLTILAQEA
jgi:hypothetical protein